VGGENGFFSAPAIAETLTGPGWLALGSAAMAFDPICGDGTAHALREAVLASACIRAIHNGQPEATVRAHYESRLLLGFRRHLALAHSFYRSGHGGPWWDAEVDAATRGIAWCDARIAAFGPPRYRLEGAELICLR
jgi:flavin-dependent dehydrogenase